MNLNAVIEHTLLAANALPREIDVLCDEALQYEFCGVCVNPQYVPRVVGVLRGKARVISVVGFPLGAGIAAHDVALARWLVGQGADEIDMVIPLGLALSGDLAAVTSRVSALRRATGGVVLKVILETGFFEPEALIAVAQAALQADPDYLKTCTGFGPRGASSQDVRALAACANGRARIKASGGIRTLQAAKALIEAGASRLGTSSGVAILQEAADPVRGGSYEVLTGRCPSETS